PGDCGHNAGAYVLGALDADEVQAFREHLKGCVVCRDEVASLGAVVQSLPMAAPQLAVNRSLRRRVMADVRAARRASVRERSGRRAFGWWPLNARGGVAAALAAGAAAALAAGLALSSSSNTHARVVQANVAAPASAEVQVEGTRARLIVRRMPAPPAGHIYEVWLKRAGGAPLATSALFGVTSSGDADVGVPGSVRGVREVLVTPERLGGSLAPTHAPVLVARIA
ncbi:MAG TPA: anti-sigma factor, partial [Solirubrobacteraceae bacterium]|nr:anti-sigma factor [Solirubrobacteraceae bacterium]